MNETKSLLNDGFVFLEGPRWHDGALWVSDMWDHRILKISADGSQQEVAQVPNRPSGLGFLPDNTLLVASMADRTVYKVIDKSLVVHADLNNFVSADINDIVVDVHGRTYVGNFGYDLFAGAPERTAELVLVEANGNAREVANDLQFPNGMVIKNAGTQLVVAETFGHKLTSFDILPNGDLSNRTVYADLGEFTPDGICLDADNHIWVASFMTGDFVRVAPDGSISQQIKVNGAAVACQLGGADLHTLYCLVFEGAIEDIASGQRLARIETVQVDVAAGGSP